MLGLGLLYRTIAQLETREERQSVWDYQVAQQFYPPISEIDLSVYGESAVRLSEHGVPPFSRWLKKNEVFANESTDADLIGKSFAEDQVSSPRRAKAKLPRRLMRQVYGNAGAESFTIQVVVNPQGRAVQPLLNPHGEPTRLLFSFLELVRSWTWEPGRVVDRPVSFLRTLTLAEAID